jgi:hypothetical protein
MAEIAVFGLTASGLGTVRRRGHISQVTADMTHSATFMRVSSAASQGLLCQAAL